LACLALGDAQKAKENAEKAAEFGYDVSDEYWKELKEATPKKTDRLFKKCKAPCIRGTCCIWKKGCKEGPVLSADNRGNKNG
jgi:hypothetical protein